MAERDPKIMKEMDEQLQTVERCHERLETELRNSSPSTQKMHEISREMAQAIQSMKRQLQQILA